MSLCALVPMVILLLGVSQPAQPTTVVPCSSITHCPQGEFCDFHNRAPHCQQCGKCAHCDCGLPFNGTKDCKRACVSASSRQNLPKYPSLPTGTVGQHAAAKRAARAADAVAAAAHSAVLSLVGEPAMKRFLHDFHGVLESGEPLSNLSATELLARVEAELLAAELVHNFGFQYPRSCGVDVTVADVPHFPDFYNQWTIQTLGIVPVDAGNNRFMEKAETNLFGFAPFKDVGAPDLATATDRPVYGALNFYRDSAANLQCGPVAAVLSKTYVGDNAVAFPVDTGNFGGNSECSDTLAEGKGDGNWSHCFHCQDCAPERPLGTPGRLTHLILPYAYYYNTTRLVPGVGDEHYPHYNLARLFTRLLSRTTYKSASLDALPLIWFENIWGYFEVNPVATIPMNRTGIKFLVASFDLFFGQPEGEQLRATCIQKGWALVWAHNAPVASLCSSVNGAPNAETAPMYKGCTDGCWSVNGQCQFDPTSASPPKWNPTGNRPNASCEGGGSCTSPRDTVAQRVLDPYVLVKTPEGHNSTQDSSFEAASAAVESVWTTARGTTSPHMLPFPKRLVLIDKLWAQLMKKVESSTLMIEPLFAGACADEQACIGVRIMDGKCVCRP